MVGADECLGKIVVTLSFKHRKSFMAERRFASPSPSALGDRSLYIMVPEVALKTMVRLPKIVQLGCSMQTLDHVGWKFKSRAKRQNQATHILGMIL
jgi:hypothetical protein